MASLRLQKGSPVRCVLTLLVNPGVCVTTACTYPLGVCRPSSCLWGGFVSLHGVDLAEIPEGTVRLARAVFP